MVPKGWSCLPLSDVCKKQISYGIVQTGENETNGTPCLRVIDLTKEVMRPEEMIKTSDDINQAYKKTILEKDEVVMALRGEVGLVRLIGPNLVGANITRGLARISAKKSIAHPEFLLWELRSPIFRADLMRRVGGSALQEISLSELRKVRTLLPPLPEQKKIAQILSTWDKAITTTEQLLVNSQQQKKALMQQLLTGKKRLLDKNGVRFEGAWQACQLSDVVSSLDSGVSVNGVEQDIEASYFVLKTSCVSDGVFTHEETKRVIEEKEITRLKEPLRDDSILISRMNTPVLVGANAYVETAPDDTYLPDRLWQVKVNPSKVLMRWLAFWFSSEKTRTALTDLASGTSGSMKNISKKSVLAMSIQCPSLEEQQKIAAVLSSADQEITALQQKLHALKQEKKALMQQLLTGKRRVKIQ